MIISLFFICFVMTTFFDFVDRVPSIDALSFYDIAKKNILQSEFLAYGFNRRRDFLMMIARRKCKLVADIHWLNRCFAVESASL